jgi:hypothetical protein
MKLARPVAVCITAFEICCALAFAAPAKMQAPQSTTKLPAKPAAKKVVKPAPPAAVQAPAQAPAAPGPDAAAPPKPAGERDPFAPLVSEKKEGSGPHLPPGKAGLMVATVRVDGTVQSGNGMIAVVANPEEHVYFIRVGDKLYDGDVEKISLDGVTFREDSKDAFGKPIERMVTKRIYASAGEQQ